MYLYFFSSILFIVCSDFPTILCAYSYFCYAKSFDISKNNVLDLTRDEMVDDLRTLSFILRIKLILLI